MERIRLPILMVLCSYMVALLSCGKEKNIVNVKPLPQNTTEVTFAVALPGLSQNISTYAITDNEENKISTIDVLVFLVSGSNELYSYRVRGKNIKQLTENSSQFQVTLQTNATNNTYRFVVIANARSAVDAISYPTTGAASQKANILNNLIISKPGVWNANSPANYEPLPMWGETASPVVVNGNTGSMTLPLLRSQARVDVNVTPTLGPDFKLTSISVYNSSANGRIAPLAGNYNVIEKKVTAPSMPSSLQTNSTPLVYNTPDWLKFEQEIYLFEKAAAASANATGAISLIIGGRYDGGVETFYKLEFLSAAATPVPLAVLRNHKYVFNITAVSGNGYPTKEAALSAKPSNMQATITTVNLNDMPIVYFDEHYYLAMQTDLLVYPTDAMQNQTHKIATDAPGGWDAISNQNWIIVSKVTGGVQMIVLGGSLSGPRNGTVTITAGKIRTRIKVYQGYGSSPLPHIP